MNHSTLFHFNYRHIFKACSSHYGSIRKCWLSKSTVYFMGSATGFCLKVILLSFPLSVFGSWNIVRSVCFFFFVPIKLSHWKRFFRFSAISLSPHFLGLRRMFTSITCFQQTKRHDKGSMTHLFWRSERSWHAWEKGSGSVCLWVVCPPLHPHTSLIPMPCIFLVQVWLTLFFIYFDNVLDGYLFT